MTSRSTRPFGILFSLILLAAVTCASAQTNLLTNGSFELDSAGKVFPNGGSSSAWRWFAVQDTTGTAILRAGTAASQGNVGLELVRGDFGTPGLADSAIDKYIDGERIPVAPRVYQLLVDAKDGGRFGSTNALYLQMQFPAPAASPYVAYDPGATFETFGFDAASTNSSELSARAALYQSNSSAYLDNFRVYDVTEHNRVVNAGFENSSVTWRNWRDFQTVPSTLLTSFTASAASGARALRFERTGIGGDAGLDLAGSMIPVFGGERLEFSAMLRKAAGDANTRVQVIMAEYDINGNWTTRQLVLYFNPGSSFTRYGYHLRVGSDARYVNLAFRVCDNTGSYDHLGGYVIDDAVIQRSTNLLDNGSFEYQNDGDRNGGIVGGWRVPFADTAGTVTVRAAAASQGNLGIELAHAGGNFWLDRWVAPTPPTSKPGIYKLLMDARNGGVFSSQDAAVVETVMHDSPWPEYGIGFAPGSNYETFGGTSPFTITRSGIDVRLTPSGTPNQSMFADNFQLIDVTRGNRVVNGGFENSASRLVNWRSYSLNAGEFLSTLNSDAHSGANALRIERTYAGAGDNDGAVDLFSDRIATLPGEPLEISLWAKKLSGDADARLAVIVTEWSTTTTNQLVDMITLSLQDPGSHYERLIIPVNTNANTTSALNVALCILQPDTGRHVGAYLIDDVQVVRNRAPHIGSATLANASDQTVVTVTPSGWSDADNDPAQYLYQWKLNGNPIPGATSWAIPRNLAPGAGTISCDVTAWDGISPGNTVSAEFPPSFASIIEAGRGDAITVNGNASDWTALASRVLPMSVYGQNGEDMLVNIRFAWNPTNLYFLIEEIQDDNQLEAPNQDTFRNDGAYFFDAISFWISFINGPTLLNGDFNPWFGFSSAGRTDLFTERINNQGTFDEAAFTNAHVATGGTFASHNRVIEASVTWADLASVLASNYQPYGGLVAAVGNGFTFGCEPLLIDNGAPGQAFRTGQTHVYPSGSDTDSIDVKLVPADYALNRARNWNLYE